MTPLKQYIEDQGLSSAAFARKHAITRQRVHEMIKQDIHVHNEELWLRSRTEMNGRSEDSKEVHDESR